MIKSHLKIRLLQMDIQSANPEANAKRIVGAITQAGKDAIDLLCAPEMCLTGFDWQLNKGLGMRVENAVEIIRAAVQENGVAFCGTTYRIGTDGKARNSAGLIIPLPDKTFEAWYHKIHLFSLMDEPAHLCAGEEIVTVNTPWGCMGLAICYDLRFSEFFQVMSSRGARVILIPAAWPAKRCHHWRTLLQARAIENQCFIVAVNQVGLEGEFGSSGDDAYAGHSMVVDSFGNIAGELDGDVGQLDAVLDLNSVDQARKAIHTLQHRRPDVYVMG
jgi:omega-amidase